MAGTDSSSSESKIHVRRLQISNFKSFPSYDMEFADFNVLVGTNNCGKSSLLQAVQAPFEFLADILKSVDDVLEPGLSRTAIETSFFRVSDIQEIWTNRKYRGPGSHSRPVSFGMELSNGFRCKFALNLYYRQAHVEITECDPHITAAEVEQLISKRPILIPGFVGLLTREEFRTPARRNQIITDGRHTEVLRNVLLELKNQHPDRFSALNSAVEQYFGVKLSNIDFAPETDQFITADYNQEGAQLDLVTAGSGFLQILQLLTFFYFVNPHIVLLDEPDAHLHSSLQRSLMELLQEIGKKQAIQFIIATHSKEIINHAQPESIVAVSNAQERAQRLSSYTSVLETLRGIGAIDNVDVALLVKNKRCLFVEDSMQSEVLKRFSRLMGKQIFEGDSQLVVVVRGGVTVTRYYDDLPVLRQFLGTDIKSISVIDGDYATEDMKKEMEAESKDRGVDLHVLWKSEIENYLLNIGLLTRLGNIRSSARGGPKISSSEMESIFEQALEQVKPATADLFSQQISNWSKWKGSPIAIPTANAQARDYVEAHWSTMEGRLSICPGKDVLSKVNSALQSKYGISVSFPSLLSEIATGEVDDELRKLLDRITALWKP
jgi:hypothetical protein